MEKIREELICAVCLDFLDEPKVLQCAHSFCLRCLREVVKEQKRSNRSSSARRSLNLECPSCRHVTILDHGRVDLDLRTNANLKRLVQIISEEEKRRTLNVLQHRSSRQTHTQTMEKSPRCKVHRQPLETFCQDCSEVVCQTCAKTGHKTHTHSSLSELENLLKEKVAALRNLIQPCCEVASMADRQMLALKEDSDTVLSNSDSSREAVKLYFNELRRVVEQREKAVLNTVQKYADIKLSTLDLHHQKLQEDHMAITKAVESLQRLLAQNDGRLHFSLLASSQVLEDELEVHQNSVLTVCDSLSQAKLASKFLCFSGDQVLLSEPLKEAGVLNECQRIPDTNILSMQRVVISEHEDPYLLVPSRFEDLQTNGPQKEVRIDSTKKSQRVMKTSDMVEGDDIEYVIPRKFMDSPSSDTPVRSLAEGLLFQAPSVPRKVKQTPTKNGADSITIDGRIFDLGQKSPESKKKVPPPPPHKTRGKAPLPPPRTTPQKLPPQHTESLEGQKSPKPVAAPALLPTEEIDEDTYSVPRSVLLEDIYSVPRSVLQDGSSDDIYNIPRPQPQDHVMEDTYDVPQKVLTSPVPSPSSHSGSQEDMDVYSVPKPSEPLPPPRPPKPTDNGSRLSPQPLKDGHPEVPPRAPSPKPRAMSICGVNYVNTNIEDIVASNFWERASTSVPSAHPSMGQQFLPSASAATSTRSKPTPIPRPRRTKTFMNKSTTETPQKVAPPVEATPTQPPQSAPPIENTSKKLPKSAPPVENTGLHKFVWNGEATSANAAIYAQTLPPDVRMRVSRSVIREPIAILTSEQLGQPVSNERVYPCGVCCSPITDTLVMTDVYNHCIRLVDLVSRRSIERIGKEGRSGGQFKEPSAVVMDSNENIFVAELDNPRVQKFTGRGKYLLKFGQKAFWGSQLHDPYGLALSPDNRLYITDWEKGRVLVYQKDGRHVSTIGKDHTFLKFPAGLVFDRQGNLLVTDRGKHCVWVMSPEGKPISRIGKVGKGEGEMLLPHGVAILKDNTIAVSESGNHRVSIFAPNGQFIRSFGHKGSKPGQFSYPRHICVDSKGQLIVADEHNQRIQIFEMS